MSLQARELYEFGEFRLVVTERSLERLDGERIENLPEKAFQALVLLVRRSGSLVSKDELIEHVWPDTIVEDNNLEKAIHAIRAALGEKRDGVKYVETVRKHGYRFVGNVKRLPANASVSTLPDGDEPGEQPGAPGRDSRSVRWPLVLGGTLTVLSLVVAGLYSGGVLQRSAGPIESAPIKSLAVLPLEDISGDGASEYFAEGMTEALITDLAKIGALRVISRHSVMRYKTERRPLQEIGRDLNVDAILTGSVSRSEGRVRVSVQLVRPETEQSLWAESYERDLRDVLSLQRKVAEDVGGQIKVKLTPQEETRFGTVGTVNPEAYDHYLRGKFYLHRQIRENNELAIAALEKAVAADPAFAAAHAELAQAYVWKLFLFDPNDAPALAERAFVEAEKALALDPNLAGAYLARGRLLWTPANRFPHGTAIREYRRALELDPNLDEARNQLALVYNHIGAFDKALRELERAVETNPSNSLAQFRIGETYLFQERYDEALANLRGVPSEVNPALVGHQIVWALFNLGRTEEAAAALQEYLAKFPDDNRGLFTSQQAVLAAAAGDEKRAEELIRSAIEKGSGFGHFHHTGYHIACAYALMNKRDEAVKWLETVSEEGFPCFPLFEKDKNLMNLRSDPRFVALLSRLKGQWERYTSDE